MDSNVFISWSGNRAKALADALNVFIPDVIQGASPWYSPQDIQKGRRWSSEIADALRRIQFGIICITPENRRSEWMHFEAGALARLEKSYVCPYLLGLQHNDVDQPFADFNMTLATREDTLKLMRTMNTALNAAIAPDRLDRLFGHAWQKLEEQIDSISKMKPDSEVAAPRNPSEITAEILGRLRGIEQTLDAGMAVRRAIASSGVERVVETAQEILTLRQAINSMGAELAPLETMYNLTQKTPHNEGLDWDTQVKNWNTHVKPRRDRLNELKQTLHETEKRLWGMMS